MTGRNPINKKNLEVISTGFDNFQNKLGDLFNDGRCFVSNLAGDTFKIDVQETDQEYIVEAELPGVQKSDLSIKLEEARLSILVAKEQSVDEDSKNYIHKERRYSSMSRAVFLADADSEGIKAKLENGVLTVTVPKKDKPDNSVKIDIE